MTLARVFCGIAAAEVAPWLTVAVVDDAGRLLDLRHLSDDPAGYAQLGGLLADRSNGVTPVALDRGDHLIGQLLAAARQPLAVADGMASDDYSERFSDDTSYDEMRAPLDQRRAVGLARALQAGALHAMIQNAAIDLDELKPVLGAHAAIAAGRQAAATALREVLRELYPAALRAFPDPAEFIPLKVLDALPEPSLLSASPSSRQRDAGIVAELAATGVTDAQTAMNAISALRASVEESPRRGVNRVLAPVVGETVRQAVAAVRAADAASAALVSALVERLGQLRSNWSNDRGAPARPYLVSNAPVSPAPRRIPGPAAEVPANRLAPRVSAASAAATGVPAAGLASIPSPRSPGGDWSDWPSGGYAAAAPASHGAHSAYEEPGYADQGYSDYPGGNGYSGADYPTSPGYAGSGYSNDDTYGGGGRTGENFAGPGYGGGYQPAREPYQGGYPPAPEQYPAAASAAFAPPMPARAATPQAYPPPSNQPSSYAPPPVPPAQVPYSPPPAAAAAPASFEDLVTTLSFSRDPLNDPLQASAGARPAPPGGGTNGAGGSHDPRFPTEPPRSQYGDPRQAEPPPPRPDPLTDPLSGHAPAARTVAPPPGRPTVVEPDNDLLIFSETQSAWFTFFDEESLVEPPKWDSLADDGWRAAEHLTHPTVGAATTAGLPRRVPQANLVPGSAQTARRPLRVVRDAQSIAAHTEGYFRGWRRGQEIGGYAVGQRDRAAWEFNRDQRSRLS